MAYTLKGIAGQNYGQLSADEQTKVQSAGDVASQKYLGEMGGQVTSGLLTQDRVNASAQELAQEAAQRYAEGIFTQKSDAMRLAERAKETGTVTVGNAGTIPGLQAQGQAALQGALPAGSAGANLQTGIASGSVSPTDPTQQFAASMKGNNTTAPGIAPIAPPDINQKYQQALAQTKATGLPVSNNMGDNRGVVNNALGNQPYTPNTGMINQQLQADPGYQQLLADRAEYNNVVNQSKSLVDTYKEMTAQAGLPALNTELMNMKNIIDGTEDDIRNEVTKAGGFATDSQVMALAGARNKQLIKNYNNLLETKNQATENINTMMGLASQDRENALTSTLQKLQIDQQIADYATKMQNNAKDTYQSILNQVGYAGLAQMTQGNPYYTSLVENTLGLGQGGLAQLASYAPSVSEKEKLSLELQKGQLELQKSELKTDALQRSNIQSQITERNNPVGVTPTISGKPQNASQASANGYADRVAEANVIIGNLGSKFTSSTSIGGSLPNFLQSGDRQAYEQAKRNFVTAILRRESGAAISPTEFDTAEKQYFPQAGDKSSTVAQKEGARNTAINNLYREANVNRPVLPGQIIESDGKRYRVGSDGQTLEKI